LANYTPNDALTIVKEFIKNPPIAAVDEFLVDMVHSEIWTAYPWRWTLDFLTPVALVDGTQDYAWTDLDFYRPIELWITRTDTTPDEYQPLRIIEFHPPELNIKLGFRSLQTISLEEELSKFRFETAVGIASGVTLRLDGKFQKTPTKIDTAALATSLIQPDYYFNVFWNGLLYYFYKFSDDSRAGNMTVDGRGNRQYTGQLGMYMGLLGKMMREEDSRGGTAVVFPDEPLGAGLATSYGIFGG